jgi:hypothetical protein
MQRRAATTLHLALSVLGAALYVLFVLPRWWVLTGDFPDTLATVGRIAAGVPIAAAAVPVMLSLRQSIKPELGTPELALRLRAWSAVLHVVAGVVIILTAIAEIWISIDAAGPWLFAVYGAAAAIAVLGIAAYYLSAVAEKPPAEPKPPKAAKPPKEKKEKRRKRGSKIDDDANTSEEVTPAAEAANEVPAIAQTIDADAAEVETQIADTQIADTQPDVTATDTEATETSATAEVPAASGLRNKRPTGKSRHRLPR